MLPQKYGIYQGFLKQRRTIYSTCTGGGMLTISRKASNPKELYKIMKKLFRAVGSQKRQSKWKMPKKNLCMP
jgi:hypothetical protein